MTQTPESVCRSRADHAECKATCMEMSCASLDLDAVERAEYRRMIAMVKRARRLAAAPTWDNDAEMEGLRVQLLSQAPGAPLPALAGQMRGAAYALHINRKHTLTSAHPEAVAHRARHAQPRDWTTTPAGTCPRCHQTMIAAGRCATCDQSDHDQGDQLGLLEVPAANPKPNRNQPATAQAESLF